MSSLQLREIEDKLRNLLPIPDWLINQREEVINSAVAFHLGGKANHPGTPDIELEDIGIEAKKKVEDRDTARELVRKLNDRNPGIKRKIPLVYISVRQDLKDWIEEEINSEVITNSITPVGTKGGGSSKSFEDSYLLEAYERIYKELKPELTYHKPPKVRDTYITLNLAKNKVLGYGSKADLIVSLNPSGYKLDVYIWNREASEAEVQRLDNFRVAYPESLKRHPEAKTKNYTTGTRYLVTRGSSIEEFSNQVVEKTRETLELLRSWSDQI